MRKPQKEYYYNFGWMVVMTEAKISIAAEFTRAKRANRETAIWMPGDADYDILDWHDHLLAAGVVSVTPHNPRNTDDPLDIEYRIEDRIGNHDESIQLEQSVLDETYNRRIQVDRMVEDARIAALGRYAPEAAPTHEEDQMHAVSSTRHCDYRS